MKQLIYALCTVIALGFGLGLTACKKAHEAGNDSMSVPTHSAPANGG